MHTQKIRKIGFYLLIPAVAVIISSCKGGARNTEQDMTSDTLNKEVLASEIKEVLYPLPAPVEMTQMLNDIGATYTSGILNSPAKVERYLTEERKAVNLGVYAADLAYAATFEQQQDVQKYLSSIKSLADQLGVTYDYEDLLSEDNKAKFENKDTLTEMVTDAVYDTYQYLDQNSDPNLAVDMVAGVWVELMYIATNISEASYNFTGLVDIISKQKDSYEKVMSLLAARNSNPGIKELETKLAALKPAFDKVESGLSQADYNLILTTIKNVRNSLV